MSERRYRPGDLVELDYAPNPVLHGRLGIIVGDYDRRRWPHFQTAHDELAVYDVYFPQEPNPYQESAVHPGSYAFEEGRLVKVDMPEGWAIVKTQEED